MRIVYQDWVAAVAGRWGKEVLLLEWPDFYQTAKAYQVGEMREGMTYPEYLAILEAVLTTD